MELSLMNVLKTFQEEELAGIKSYIDLHSLMLDIDKRFAKKIEEIIKEELNHAEQLEYMIESLERKV